jgi:hypothetical protein
LPPQDPTFHYLEGIAANAHQGDHQRQKRHFKKHGLRPDTIALVRASLLTLAGKNEQAVGLTPAAI